MWKHVETQHAVLLCLSFHRLAEVLEGLFTDSPFEAVKELEMDITKLAIHIHPVES